METIIRLAFDFNATTRHQEGSKMKLGFFLLLASSAMVLLAAAENQAEDKNNEEQLQLVHDFFSALSPSVDFENTNPQLTGADIGDNYKTCVKIRCPINCVWCICKCIKWR